jgi:hypothetical protein
LLTWEVMLWNWSPPICRTSKWFRPTEAHILKSPNWNRIPFYDYLTKPPKPQDP